MVARIRACQHEWPQPILWGVPSQANIPSCHIHIQIGAPRSELLFAEDLTVKAMYCSWVFAFVQPFILLQSVWDPLAKPPIERAYGRMRDVSATS